MEQHARRVVNMKITNRQKFGNKPRNGFDSRKEEARYRELLLLERAGKITDLKRQVKFELIPAQHDEKGKCIERAVNYWADFVYTEDRKVIVEDAKGFRTDVFKIKKKLMLYMHGIRIKET